MKTCEIARDAPMYRVYNIVYSFDYLHPVKKKKKRETMTVDLITRPENDGVHDLPGTRRE